MLDNCEVRGFRTATLRIKRQRSCRWRLCFDLDSFRYCWPLGWRLWATDCNRSSDGRHNEALCFGCPSAPRIRVAIARLYPQTTSQGDWSYRGTVAKRQVSWERNSRSEQKGRVYMIIISQTRGRQRAASRGLTYHWAGSRGVTSKP